MPRPKGSKNKKKLASSGLGDSIKSFTEAMGITPCKGCNRRARFLNKAFPFNQKKGEMTKDQYNNWIEFIKKDYTSITQDQMDLIEDTYNAIYHTALMPCRNCGAKGWLQLIKGINKVYESYGN